MIRKSLLFLWATLILAAVGFSQTQSRVPNSAAPLATGTCQSTFTSGNGITFLEFCVTVNGNVAEFQSPQGWEHIREGTISEGYAICDLSNDTRYFDYAELGDSGNWNAPVRTQPGGPNTFPLKIARTTADGFYTLTQTFTRNSADQSANVSMTLKNNRAVLNEAYLVRFADIDANSADRGDFQNEFDFGQDAAWGSNHGLFGLRMSGKANFPQFGAFAQNTSVGPDACNPFGLVPATTPFLGDGSAGVYFSMGFAAGKSQTVSVEYKPF